MTYKWEKESLEKYGKEITQNLISQQKKYESMKIDNDCEHCGRRNEGAMIEPKNGAPFILHFGLWSNGRCNYCGRNSGRKK
ncbi:hypothetical protein [Bacillus albus]|uniref:hypothetical protein n=1 Tax=Bacillus albus TaxID=2026189 RepID=UPI003014440E